MIFLRSVHFNGVRQTFLGQEHFQANITITTYFKKNMIDFYTTKIIKRSQANLFFRL